MLTNLSTAAKKELALFEDPILNMHDKVMLVKMITKETVMTHKVKLLDNYLEKLHHIINEVAM